MLTKLHQYSSSRAHIYLSKRGLIYVLIYCLCVAHVSVECMTVSFASPMCCLDATSWLQLLSTGILTYVTDAVVVNQWTASTSHRHTWLSGKTCTLLRVVVVTRAWVWMDARNSHSPDTVVSSAY